MQRSILNIAFATASVLAAATVQAAGFPASGEFSAADEAQAPVAVTTTRSEVRNATRDERAASLHVNGEVTSAPATAPTQLTRQEVRKQGNDALRARQLPAGEAAI